MTNIESGTNKGRYYQVKDGLAQGGAVVIEEKTDSLHDERKGIEYTRTRIIVAPAQGALEGEGLVKFGSGLLPGVESVYPHIVPTAVGKITTLKTFDREGDNSFHTIAVEVYPSAQKATQVQELRNRQ